MRLWGRGKDKKFDNDRCEKQRAMMSHHRLVVLVGSLYLILEKIFGRRQHKDSHCMQTRRVSTSLHCGHDSSWFVAFLCRYEHEYAGKLSHTCHFRRCFFLWIQTLVFLVFILVMPTSFLLIGFSSACKWIHASTVHFFVFLLCCTFPGACSAFITAIKNLSGVPHCAVPHNEIVFVS